ncbi:MAG: FenI protein, partial [Bacteroidales bacterium]|nr:FenI protein [Bacteroidales bacterium]
FYNSSALKNNKIGISDAIKTTLRNKVLLPYLGRTAEQKPATPTDIKLNGTTLTWSGNAAYYAIYKLEAGGKKAALLGTTTQKTYTLPTKGTYFISALTAVNEESEISDQIDYK